MNRSALYVPVGLLLITSLTACGGGPELEGSYLSSAEWDLSAPFGENGIGGGLSDLLIEGIVGSVVPGFLEDEAIEVVSSLLEPRIVAAVDSQLPPELRKDGEAMVRLRTAFSAVTAQSRFDIDNDFKGREAFLAMTFPRPGGGPAFTLARDAWIEGVGGLEVEGKVEPDDEDDGVYKLKQYELEIQLGRLINRVAEEFLTEATFQSYELLVSYISCSGIAGQLVDPTGEIPFTVAGKDFSISEDTFVSICGFVLDDQIAKYTAFIADVGTGVSLGGPVRIVDTDNDGIIDRLASEPDFEGRITLLPGPFEPRLGVDFEANRDSALPL